MHKFELEQAKNHLSVRAGHIQLQLESIWIL